MVGLVTMLLTGCFGGLSPGRGKRVFSKTFRLALRPSQSPIH